MHELGIISQQCMNKTIILIDGENYIYKLEDVLKKERVKINRINIY